MTDTADNLIQANNFGGLNLLASPVNAPHTDATRLFNVDTNPSGQLTKRRGTFVFQDVAATSMHVHSGVTNRGIPFVVRVYNKGVTVYTVENGTRLVQLRDIPNVFRHDKFTPSFVTLPGETMRVLILSASHPPVQLQFHEYAATTPGAVSGSAYVALIGAQDFYVGNTSLYNASWVFVNGQRDSRKPVLEATLTRVQGPFNADDVVSSLYISWQWWAESETWRGDNFYKEQPRFNADISDAVVAVPSTISSDLTENQELANPPAYGIHAHRGNVAGGITANLESYQANGRPTLPWQYSFSDGSIYSPSMGETETLIPSPFFITFGSHDPFLEYTYSDFHVNPTLNRIRIIGHGFGERTSVFIWRWNSATTAFTGGVAYVKPIGPDQFELYSDIALTSIINLSTSRPTKTFTTTDVDTTNSRFTLPNTTNFFNTMECTFSVSGGTLPAGLTPGVRYYFKIHSGVVCEVYFDAELQNKVNITSTGTGSFRIHREMDLRIRTNNRRRCIFTRIRRLRFFDSYGVDTSALTVTVNGVPLSLNTTPSTTNNGWWAFGTAPALANVITSGTARWYCVPNEQNYQGTNFGISSWSRVRITHNSSQWVGSAASTARYVFGTVSSYNGTWVPVYGLSRYASYARGDFPSTGDVFQGRLVLSGFPTRPNLVLFSAIRDFAVKDEYYNYFQVTNDLRGDSSDPFEVTLSDTQAGGIVRIYAWQNAVFVFTREAVFRIQGANTVITFDNRSVILLSRKGAMNQNCIAATERMIYYLSQTGLYHIPLVESNEYRSEEVSIKIRPVFELHNFILNKSWVSYSPSTFKLYMGLDTKASGTSDRLFVYDVQQDSWSEYGSYRGFRIWSMAHFYERVSEGFPVVGCTDGCRSYMMRFDSAYYTDFTREFNDADTSLAVTRLPHKVLTTSNATQAYVIPFYSSVFSNVRDFNVWYGESLATVQLLPDSAWTKQSDGTIFLESSPSDTGFLVFTPRAVSTWHGVAVVINDTMVTGSDYFGAPNFASPCATYSADFTNSVLGVGGDVLVYEDTTSPGDDFAVDIESAHIAHVGDIYLAEYASIALTQQFLWVQKRSEQLVAWFRQIGSAVAMPEDTSILSTALGVRYNSIAEGRVRESIFTSRYVASTSEWVVFKESLQHLGYAHQVVVWSNDAFAWKLDAWQLKVSIVGSSSGHFSGKS
jgi:hypothetical protein